MTSSRVVRVFVRAMAQKYAMRDEGTGMGGLDDDNRTLDRPTTPGSEGAYAWDEEQLVDDVRLTREQLLYHIERRRAKFKHLLSLPYTVILLIVYTATLFAHMDMGAVHDVSRGVTDTLLAKDWGESPRRTFTDTRTTEHFWGWMDGALLPALFNSSAVAREEPLDVINGVPVYASSINATSDRLPSRKAVMPIQQYNVIVGGVAIKKTRAYEQPCSDTDPAYLFYTDGGSEQQSCYPAELVAASCWNFNNCSYINMTSDVAEPARVRYSSEYTQYSEELMYIDLVESLDAARAVTKHAASQNWIDRSTLSVTIELPVYNAELTAYALLRLNVEFKRGGAVIPSAVVTMSTRPVVDSSELSVLRGATVALLAWMFLEEGTAMVWAVLNRRRLEYCVATWTITNWGIIMLAIYIVSEWNFFRVDLMTAEDNLLGEEALPVKRVDVINFVSGIVAATERFDRFRALNALLMLLLVARLTKPLIIHTRLGFLSGVIGRALVNLVPFVWIFVPIFLVFSAVAHLIFGGTLTEFVTLAASSQSLFNMLLGETGWRDLQYSGANQGPSLEALATAFFGLFYVTMYYLLLNVMLAIVLDAYSEIKAGWTVGLPVWHEIRSAWRLARARMAQGEGIPHPMVNLGVVAERLAAHTQTVFTESDVRYELGVSAAEAAIIVADCQEEISRQEDLEVQAGGSGGGGGWSGTVMANQSEGLARILEGVTALQVEMLETKLRVNNMAARMGINTRSAHVQTHISYQPSNKLTLQNVEDPGERLPGGLGQAAPWETGAAGAPITPPTGP